MKFQLKKLRNLLQVYIKRIGEFMAVGAKDYIDQLLVKKYASLKMDNHDRTASMVSPEKKLEVMNDYADVQRSMLAMQQKLHTACKALNTRNSYCHVRA